MEIKEALEQLDVLDDDHWTTDGLPRVDAVEGILGRDVSRQDITDAAPGFNRDEGLKPDSDPDLESESGSDPLEIKDPIDAVEAEIESKIHDLSVMLAEANRQYEDAKNRMKTLSTESDILSMRLQRIRRSRPKRRENTDIGAYLAQAAKTRQERAERAMQFIVAGTSAADVVKALNPKAPIDQALNRRKAAPGSTRPASNLPVRK